MKIERKPPRKDSDSSFDNDEDAFELRVEDGDLDNVYGDRKASTEEIEMTENPMFKEGYMFGRSRLLIQAGSHLY